MIYVCLLRLIVIRKESHLWQLLLIPQLLGGGTYPYVAPSEILDTSKYTASTTGNIQPSQYTVRGSEEFITMTFTGTGSYYYPTEFFVQAKYTDLADDPVYIINRVISKQAIAQTNTYFVDVRGFYKYRGYADGGALTGYTVTKYTPV